MGQNGQVLEENFGRDPTSGKDRRVDDVKNKIFDPKVGGESRESHLNMENSQRETLETDNSGVLHLCGLGRGKGFENEVGGTPFVHNNSQRIEKNG